MSFIYHRLRWDSPGGVQTQATNNYAIDTFGTDYVKLDYGLAKLDTIFTASLTNELRFQYGRELNNESAQPVSPYNPQFASSNAFRACLPPSPCRPAGSAIAQYYAFRPANPR